MLFLLCCIRYLNINKILIQRTHVYSIFSKCKYWEGLKSLNKHLKDLTFKGRRVGQT